MTGCRMMGGEVKIYIVGAGGIGSVVAAELAREGHPVVIVDSWADHVHAINSNGLRVESPSETFVTHVPAFQLDNLDLKSVPWKPDVILLSVKSGYTKSTLEVIRPFLDENAVVISLQNRINEEEVADTIGPRRTIGAVVLINGALRAPGHATKTAKVGNFVIGELDGRETRRISKLTTLLEQVAPTRNTNNIWGELWSKLVINCCFNAVCAVSGLGVGEVVVRSELRAVGLSLARETVEVAQAQNIRLVQRVLWDLPPETFLAEPSSPMYDELVQCLVQRYRPFPDLKPSMLQDAEKGRRTEIDYMNGWVSRKGRNLGISTPASDHIVQLVKQVEDGQLRRNPANLDTFYR